MAVESSRPAAATRQTVIQSPPFPAVETEFPDEQQTTFISNLAREFWPNRDATMRAPMAYFSGEYPAHHPGHTCRAAVQMTLTEAGVTYRKMTSKLWRARVGESGAVLEACPGCRQERALRACRQFEGEAKEFDAGVTFRFAVLPLPAASVAVTTINNWNKRHDLNLRYWVRPLTNEMAALVHNVQQSPTERTAATFDTFSGDELPRDKSALFDLVHGWFVDAGDGRERHSKQWGGDYRGNKGNGQKQKGGDDEGDEQPLPAVEIMLQWTANIREAVLVQRYGDDAHRHKLPAYGTLDMTGPELIRLLDDAGIYYACISGRKLLHEWQRRNAQSPPSDVPIPIDSRIKGVLPC